MSIEDDIAFLETVPALALLGRDALRILAIGAESRYIHSGSVLFSEGESADAAYVVQDGSFTVASSRDPAAARPAIVRAGTMLGGIALLTDTQRPVTAAALEPSNVLRITRTLFLKTMEGYPDAARRMREELVRRADAVASDIRAVRSVLE